MFFELFLALIALFGWGLMDFFSKKLSSRIEPVRFIFLVLFLEFLWCLFLILFNPPKQIDLSFFSIASILIAGIIGALGYLFMYKAIAVEKISIVSPILASSLMITLLISTLFFGETISIFQIFAIAAIFIGIVLVSTKFGEEKTKVKFSKGIMFALISMACFGVSTAFTKTAVMASSPEFAQFIFRLLGVAIIFFYYCGVEGREDKSEQDINPCIPMLVLISLLDMAAVIAFNYAVSTQLTSLVTPVAYSYSIVAVVLGYFVLKEKLSWPNWVGIAGIIAGIIVLAL